MNLFRDLESDWALVPDLFWFWKLCPLKGTGFERKNKVDFFKAFVHYFSLFLKDKHISLLF